MISTWKNKWNLHNQEEEHDMDYALQINQNYVCWFKWHNYLYEKGVENYPPIIWK